MLKSDPEVSLAPMGELRPENMEASPAPIVVVGSGLAGYGVLRELRRLDPAVPLVLVSADAGHFYSKPGLSTALAKRKSAPELVTSRAEAMASQLKLKLMEHVHVHSIHPEDHYITTSAGKVSYAKLILALGANPVPLALGGDAAAQVRPVNHIDDYADFRERLEGRRHVAIIGAGLVGCEFANDLSAAGYVASVIDPMALPMPLLLPPPIGEALKAALAACGVDWHLGRSVQAVDHCGAGFALSLSDGTVLQADLVLSAVGLRSNVELARTAGLATHRGICVDANGRSSDPDIYALGDCAEYPTGVAHYVTPIMSAARAIAAAATGAPTPMRMPVLSVVVKTTAYPIALLPVPTAIEGNWEDMGSDSAGFMFGYRDHGGRLVGYVLTGARCPDRPKLDSHIAAAISGEAQ